MSDVRHTFTDLDDGVDAETVGVQVTLVEGGPGGAPIILLAHGVSTPPAGTPIGTVIFQKGA
jgi:hypothetical protein